MIRSYISLAAVALPAAVAGCAPGYTRAEVVYGEPAQYEYAVPADRVVVVTREVLVTQAPPVVRVEAQTVAPGPGYVYTRGYWRWTGTRYVWVSGSWVTRPRTTAVWVEGTWVRRPGGWVWVSGHWR